MIRPSVIAVSAIIFFLNISVIPTCSAEAELVAQLSAPLSKLMRRYKQPSENLGLWIVDLTTEEVIENFNGNQLFIPASVLKILTARYALEVLGPRYRWRTELGITGPVENGILKGDLYLIGKGDPLLKSGDLLDLAYALKARGIQSVEGQFYYDASFLLNIDRITSMGPQDESYNTGLSGLNINFNRFELVRMGRRRDGRRANFGVIPQIPSLGFGRTKIPFPTGESYLSDNNETQEIWKVNWYKRYSKRRPSLPLRGPARHAAGLFRMFAKGLGIELKTAKEKKSPAEIQTLIAHRGPSVADVSKSILEYSNNTLSEILLLTTSRQKYGMPASLTQAASQMKKWMRKRYPDLPWGELTVVNGSGLDSQNEISPRLLTQFLTVQHSLAIPPYTMASLLSISGQSGWLKKRLASPDLALKVWAKTGTLDFVSGLAGYFWGKSGKFYAFSLFLNDRSKRKIMDQRDHPRYSSTLRKAMKWRHRAKALENAVMENLINRL